MKPSPFGSVNAKAQALVLQICGIFLISWWGARWLKLPHKVAGPAGLIGMSKP
jgi:ACR3 family arsenite transporter